MNEWIKNNLWSLLIAAVGVITTFSIYGYRIDDLDRRMNANTVQIQTLNTQQVNLQVQLAQISTDISYIKASLDRILK